MAVAFLQPAEPAPMQGFQHRGRQQPGVIWSSRRAHLVLVSPRAVPPRTVATPQIYRRRRLVLMSVLLALLSVVVFTVAGMADRPTGVRAELPAPIGMTGGWTRVDDGLWRYVVAEGESLWGIASRFDGGVSQRQVVDDMVANSGSARLVPGQVLEIRR